MVSRQQLHEQLCTALGSRHVYYQPPENLKMEFPCIVYMLQDLTHVMANNEKYLKNRSYKVILISHEPDPAALDNLENLDYIRFQQMYMADGLYHYVFRKNT